MAERAIRPPCRHVVIGGAVAKVLWSTVPSRIGYKDSNTARQLPRPPVYRNCVMVPLSDGLLTNTLPYYPGQFLETDYAESIETPLGELDRPSDADASAPDLPASDSAAEEIELPVPDEGVLPESWEAWLQNGQFPEVESSDSSTAPVIVRDPRFGPEPPLVIAAAQPFDSTAPPAASSIGSVAPRGTCPCHASNDRPEPFLRGP